MNPFNPDFNGSMILSASIVAACVLAISIITVTALMSTFLTLDTSAAMHMMCGSGE